MAGAKASRGLTPVESAAPLPHATGDHPRAANEPSYSASRLRPSTADLCANAPRCASFFPRKGRRAGERSFVGAARV